ncbi:MAG: tRNA (adenosine(37)-N6)-threonylcarbamoyltransferase complex ATPase subunit type 1 TsaE [Aquificaceae bacterium]
MRLRLKTEEELRTLGRKIGAFVKLPKVICLKGEIGSGKTTLVKAIAEGMGISGAFVRSPTFTILNEYETSRGKLLHADLYRVEDLSLEEFSIEGLLIIEWPKKTTKCDCTIEFYIEEPIRILDFSNCQELWKV